MYVDDNSNQFCVDADKGSETSTFYKIYDSTKDTSIEDLMNYYFPEEQQWQTTGQYVNKFYTQNGYLAGDPISISNSGYNIYFTVP